jgi:hypothetical protein
MAKSLEHINHVEEGTQEVQAVPDIVKVEGGYLVDAGDKTEHRLQVAKDGHVSITAVVDLLNKTDAHRRSFCLNPRTTRKIPCDGRRSRNTPFWLSLLTAGSSPTPSLVVQPP